MSLAFAVLVLAAGSPEVLRSRQTLVQNFVLVERESWVLTLAGPHATLERVSERAVLPAGSISPRKVPLPKAAAQGAAARRRLHWAETARSHFEGTLSATSGGFSAQLGPASLECTWSTLPIHAANAQLVLPAKPVECGDGSLVWASSAPTKPERVAVCSVSGLEMPSWAQTLTFLLGAGVENVTEEDDCLGGEGLRRL
jgi:hypothetical protein